MSTIFFPGYRADKPTNPWICTLCSQCGQLTRKERGDASAVKCVAECVVTDPRTAVILVLSEDQETVWHQLTRAGIADHVTGRVLRIMYGEER